MNLVKKAIGKKTLFHFLFWTGFHLIFFISVLKFEGIQTSLKYSICFISPLIIPVYLHSFIFEKFFRQKKYLLYLIFTLPIILIFGYLNKLLIEKAISGNTEPFLLLIFSILMFTGFKYLKIGTKQQFQLQNEENRRIKAELDLLKSQLNPHFMFNTLNNIYSLILDKDDRASEVVLKLSDLMRYLLDTSKQKFVALNDEFDFIKNYISLEEIRLLGSCKVNLFAEGDLSAKKIAPMMFIPFVENCFKHGIGMNSSNNFININLKAFEKKILLTTENMIVYNKKQLQIKKEKTGLENIKRRLEQIYPNRYKLNIFEEDNIYKVNFELEL